jgi:hypothetical protein
VEIPAGPKLVSARVEELDGLGQAPPAPSGRQRLRARRGLGVIRGVQGVEHLALQRLQVVDVHPRHATARQNRWMGLTNDELTRRYQAGEPVDELAAAAEMTRSGMYDRLHRLGVAPRTSTETNIDDETIRQALTDHKSINAAAKALGLPRSRLTAEAIRLGLRDPPANIPTDLIDLYRQQGSLERVAEHYGTSAPTVGRWLRSLGVPLQPGRKPRDG